MLSRLSGRARELADQAMVELRDALEDEEEQEEEEQSDGYSPNMRPAASPVVDGEKAAPSQATKEADNESDDEIPPPPPPPPPPTSDNDASPRHKIDGASRSPPLSVGSSPIQLGGIPEPPQKTESRKPSGMDELIDVLSSSSDPSGRLSTRKLINQANAANRALEEIIKNLPRDTIPAKGPLLVRLQAAIKSMNDIITSTSSGPDNTGAEQERAVTELMKAVEEETERHEIERARMTQEVSRTNAENAELKRQLENLKADHEKALEEAQQRASAAEDRADSTQDDLEKYKLMLGKVVADRAALSEKLDDEDRVDAGILRQMLVRVSLNIDNPSVRGDALSVMAGVVKLPDDVKQQCGLPVRRSSTATLPITELSRGSSLADKFVNFLDDEVGGGGGNEDPHHITGGDNSNGVNDDDDTNKATNTV